MDSSRRTLLTSASLAAAGMLNGCVTHKLFANHAYNERVSSILVSADGKKLVVISPKYHYIFDLPSQLWNSLQPGIHPHLAAEFNQFHIDKSGRARGSLRLRMKADAPTDAQQQAQSLGYLKQKNGQWIADIKLTGIRCASNGIEAKQQSQRLNQEYQIHVDAEQSYAETAVKSLATPITLTTDGVLVIVGVPLFLLMVGVVWIGFHSA